MHEMFPSIGRDVMFDPELLEQRLLHAVRPLIIDSVSLSRETGSRLQTVSNFAFFNDSVPDC